MTVAIDGLTFAVGSDGSTPNSGYIYFTGTGTYTAADFVITAEDGLGFTPSKVRVVNLTERNETVAWNAAAFNADTSMAIDDEGLKSVAAGTRTYADHGIGITGEREVSIDYDVAGPLTDNCDFVIEMWR